MNFEALALWNARSGLKRYSDHTIAVDVHWRRKRGHLDTPTLNRKEGKMISIDTPNLCLPQKRPKLPWNWNGKRKKQGKVFFFVLSLTPSYRINLEWVKPNFMRIFFFLLFPSRPLCFMASSQSLVLWGQMVRSKMNFRWSWFFLSGPKFQTAWGRCLGKERKMKKPELGRNFPGLVCIICSIFTVEWWWWYLGNLGTKKFPWNVLTCLTFSLNW